ncbi:glycosyltransferase [Candidatus Aalborgicola defluviihabitans]|uniref:glycosyltransferase n=1 Tax=Candidatus Aalborgicola defluviihabitans TaxID=3386187 RepID=UPI001DF9E0DE|nr:glycosyltransferase [Burkholderiales bacterium]
MSIAVSIVIVNWNTGDMLRECCQSIVSSDMTGIVLKEVIVVDNASTDGSAQGLAHIGLPLHLVANDGNRGFGVACNQGAALATGEFILFLNPDVRLYKRTRASTLDFMSSTSSADIGICGVRLEDQRGKYTTSFASFPSVWTILKLAVGLSSLQIAELPSGVAQSDTVVEVDQVIGAYFLVRSGVFHELEGFDERFLSILKKSTFLCLRGWLAGAVCALRMLVRFLLVLDLPNRLNRYDCSIHFAADFSTQPNTFPLQVLSV